jgi:hypothetical protein
LHQDVPPGCRPPGAVTRRGHLRRRRVPITSVGRSAPTCVCAGQHSVRAGTSLRLPDRPLRPQEAVHDHPGPVPAGHGGHGVLQERAVLLRVPVLHRGRDRRRVRGHQLGHRRADPGPAAGPGRPDHQRLVLARHHVRGRPCPVPARHQPVPCRPRLAAGLRARRRPRPGHPAGPPQRAREPPLAVHPRPQREGR